MATFKLTFLRASFPAQNSFPVKHPSLTEVDRDAHAVHSYNRLNFASLSSSNIDESHLQTLPSFTRLYVPTSPPPALGLSPLRSVTLPLPLTYIAYDFQDNAKGHNLVETAKSDQDLG